MLLMESTMAGCLLNAAAFLIVCMVWLLALGETSETYSSVCTHISSHCITWSLLLPPLSTTAYLVSLFTTGDLFLLSSLLKCTSLPFHFPRSLLHCFRIAPRLADHPSPVLSPLPSSLHSIIYADHPEWYAMISGGSQVIPEQRVVTWALDIWNSWDLGMSCGWGGCGAAMVVSPCCHCWATSRACSNIYRNLLSCWHQDISILCPPLCSKVNLPGSLRLTILYSWSVHILGQIMRMCPSPITLL